MNKKLLAIASLCAFSLSACQSTGSTSSEFGKSYRLHTPDGVIVTSDPEIIASYRSQPGTMIVALDNAPEPRTIITAEKSARVAP